MPIKDPNENREYQKEWQRRKRAGENTKIKGRRIGRDPEKSRKNQRKHNQKERKRRKKIKTEKLGDSCKLCGRKEGRLNTHEKNGKNHILFHNMKKSEFDTVEWENFVLLCHHCHQMAHFVLEYIGMQWEELWNRHKQFIA